MANLSALTPITTTATALSNLVLVSPQKTLGYQPLNPPGPGGIPSLTQNPPAILFHYEGENRVTIESDITDHFIEDNTAIQDQVSIKPETITVHGFIGELNNVPPAALSLLQTAANKLTIISSYTPILSESALIAYNTAFQLYQVAQNATQSAVAAWSALSGTGGESVINGQGLTPQSNQNKQQIAFQQFYGYWRNRTFFNVQTPWAVFQNMVIKSLTAIQDAETRVISDFEVTFKMIRVAQTATPLALIGRAATQGAAAVNNGSSTPTSSIPLATGLTNMGTP